MTDTTELGDLVKRLRDANTNHIDADLWMMEAADSIEALAAQLAEAKRAARYETDIAQQAIDQMRAAEAALPAVYRLALADAVQKQKIRAKEMQAEIDKNRADFIPSQSIEDIYLGRKIGAETAMTDLEKTPTPTAAELMARINEGEKE